MQTTRSIQAQSYNQAHPSKDRKRTIVSQRTVLSTVLLYYEQQQWTRDCAHSCWTYLIVATRKVLTQSHQQHPLPLVRSSTRSICVQARRPAHCVPIFLLSLFALRDLDFDRELQSMSRLCSDISETGHSFFITVLIQPSKVRWRSSKLLLLVYKHRPQHRVQEVQLKLSLQGAVLSRPT